MLHDPCKPPSSPCKLDGPAGSNTPHTYIGMISYSFDPLPHSHNALTSSFCVCAALRLLERCQHRMRNCRGYRPLTTLHGCPALARFTTDGWQTQRESSQSSASHLLAFAAPDCTHDKTLSWASVQLQPTKTQAVRGRGDWVEAAVSAPRQRSWPSAAGPTGPPGGLAGVRTAPQRSGSGEPSRKLPHLRRSDGRCSHNNARCCTER